MDAILDDINVRHLRLVSYWNQLESADGTYDFSLLDWQFEKAEAAGASVSLALGLRQPRYPECHMPEWAKKLPDGEWQLRLNRFIRSVVLRYKDSPALESYQLENEFFLRVFGECPDFDRQRLVGEYNLVKQLDPKHPIIVSRSNNAIGTPLGDPVPDKYGVTVYKRVWNANTKRYFEYPLPAWYYAFLAGVQKLTKGRDMIIHELQAEAWPPHGQFITETSLAEQNKSIDAIRLQKRFEFGIDTGMREIYLWGSEYWYYRMVKLDDPSLWNVAKEEFARHD
jgi:beta-galactosidase GanA